MRKLLVVVLAISALALAAFGCGGGNSSSSVEETSRKAVHVKPAQLPPYRAPKVDGHTFNVEVVWWKSGKERFFPETVAWTKRDLVNKPGLAHLIATPRGFRIKLSNPKAKAVKVKLWYVPQHGATKRFSWHGQGIIPLITLTKPITTTNGGKTSAKLVEISLDAYDPRFLGPHIKPHTYPGVVDIPPGATEPVG